MTSMRELLSGSAANAVRGLTAAALSAVLPLFLVALLDHDRFSVWGLALSLANFVVFLDVGVQQAVTAASGRVSPSAGKPASALPLAAALQFLLPLLAIAAAAVAVTIVVAGNLFPAVPHELLAEFRAALGFLFVAAAATLLSNVTWGHAMGSGRLGAPLLAVISGRVVALFSALATAAVTSNLAWIALAYAAPVLLALPVQAVVVRLTFSDFGRTAAPQRRGLRTGYRRTVRTLSVWSLGMFMITGLDATIVARLDFRNTGLYVLVASLAAVVVGGASAWQPAFLALVSRAGGASELAVVRACRLTSVLNLLLVGVAAVPIWPLLERLVPHADARLGYVAFVALMVASALRQFAVPAVLSAVAAHRYDGLVLPAVAESVVNLTASVVLCAAMGAAGVALGTLLGAGVGIAAILLHTFRQPVWAYLDPAAFARDVLARPLLVLTLPVGLVALAPLILSGTCVLVVQFGALATGLGLAHRFALDPEDRALLSGVVAHVTRRS